MTDRLLTPREAAAYLGLSESWLTKWRMRGAGPAYVKMTNSPKGRVRYSEEALRQWVALRSNGGAAHA